MRTTLSLILLIAGVTTAWGQAVTDGSEAKITTAELETLENALPGFLKDPSSAQLSELHKDPDNDQYICGMINAKNGFGGYTGTQPFRFGLAHGMLITGMNTPC